MVSFGPRLPDGRVGSIGSGDWPKAAGKKPASMVSCPSGVASVSPLPTSLSVLLRVPPVIDASDGPFAAAVAGSKSPSASAASTSIERFIATPFGVAADTPPASARFRRHTSVRVSYTARFGASVQKACKRLFRSHSRHEGVTLPRACLTPRGPGPAVAKGMLDAARARGELLGDLEL